MICGSVPDVEESLADNCNDLSLIAAISVACPTRKITNLKRAIEHIDKKDRCRVGREKIVMS
jgi:hypothetical protein